LTNLSNYINQLNADLVREAVLEGRLVKQISHQSGIKNAEVINGITSTLTLQQASCGLIAPTGSVTPFQNTITVCELMSAESLCAIDFEKKFYGMWAKAGSYNENVVEAFAKLYIADKMAKIQQLMEGILIAGSTTGTYSSNSNLTLCDGILSILEEGAGAGLYVTASYGTTASFTYGSTTAVTYFDNLISQMPTDIYMEPDNTIFLSYPDFRTYILNLRTLNLYHFNALESEGSMVYEIYHPGTNVKLSATVGFNYITKTPAAFSHYFLMTPASNLVYGYDMENDFESFQFFYSDLYDTTYFRSKFKIGINAKYYKYIVLGKSN
ncbi:MAG: hypothetical protein WBO46_17880, partial [Caldilineaceae bacterium]